MITYLPHRRKGFTGGGPVDAANLVGYYKADGVVYNSGTTQATNGQTVATWVDESGQGNNITQGTEADKPLFQTNKHNGLPGIRFASSDWLALGSALLTAAPITVYVVAEIDAGSGEQTLVHFTDTSQAFSSFWFRTSTRRLDWASRSGGIVVAQTGATELTAAVPFIGAGLEVSSTSRKVRADDGTQGTNTSSSAPGGIDEFAVGMARDSSPGQALTGLLYEVRVYDVEHDSTKEEEVRDELNAKWSIF